jgi:N-hydroxyarylamine O-acetyltransferase
LPSRAALDELHEAHVRAFTFDNIDVLLGRHAGIDLGTVAAKFVGQGRGGYCYEHAILLAAVLDELGYEVEHRLGRVGSPTAARTHCVVVVHLEGYELLADPGFGLSVLRPIPLDDGAQDAQHGWHFRVRREPVGASVSWTLERFSSVGWRPLHVHINEPIQPVDLLVGHHYTSTHPNVHFRQRLIVARHIGSRHVTITHDSLVVRRSGRSTLRRELSPMDVPGALADIGLELPQTDTSRIADIAAGLQVGQSPRHGA